MKQEVPLPLQMVGRMGARQIQIIGKIGVAIKEINSLRPFIRLDSIDKADMNLVSLQDEAIQLDRIFDEPSILLSSDTEEKEVKKKPFIMYQFIEMTNTGEPLLRDRRMFTLLEHLERRISDKRQAVFFNRTLVLSLAAFFIAMLSVIVTVILYLSNSPT